ncbi:MAG: DNA repair protein RadA [Candidatus Woesearchaeota archaeon]|jgi:DNA repair protein RadA
MSTEAVTIEDYTPVVEEKPVTKKVSKKAEKAEPEEKEFTITDIPGVGASTADKLMEGGFDSTISIAVATPGELVDATGMSETASRKIINYCRQNMNMGFESGEVVLERRKTVQKISTGVESFNALLGGGFETGSIVECFGEFGSSKTQIGHVLCVQMIKAHPEGIAVYVDTEKTFRPERIIELAKGAGMDPQEVLSKIKVAKAYNSDHQMLLVEKVEELINRDKLNVRLLIIDSLTSHFRAEFVGRGTLAVRQQKLNKHMHAMSKIADLYNVCVYVTNQVMSKPDSFFGDPTAAIGGHIVAHSSTFRMYLRKGKKGCRVVKLIDSPNLPDGEAAYMVTTGGLEEVSM